MRHRVSLRLIIGVIVAFCFMLGAIGATVTQTMRPHYCARCHSMERAYHAWVDDKVACPAGCIECHTGATTGVHMAKEIEDKTCMKAGCHTQDKLFAKKNHDDMPGKANETFDHETHLTPWAYEQGLRCTACHAHQGGERHFGIEQNNCNVCHFVRGNGEGEVKMVSQPDKPLWECSVCHGTGTIKKKIRIYEKEFDHASFEKPGVDCNSCHNNGTVHGTGDINRDSCYQCHDSDDIPEDYTDVNDMHYDHMVRHKVDCSPCHGEIEHKMYRDIYETDVPVIFGDVPEDTFGYVKMMKGQGGKGVPGTPDPMYLATVSCSGCHGEDVDAPVDPEVCNTCHDKGFETILKEQTELVKSQMSTLKDLLETARPAGQGAGNKLLENARHNYRLIAADGSLGVHNIKYIKDLLESSISGLKDNIGS